jgi:predicted phosphodiesterase
LIGAGIKTLWYDPGGREMRIAVISDIHGNRTAFEAVLADLERISPDVIFHGGDLADAGSSPIEIVDRIRDLGWKGVAGNTDQMLAMPETLEKFAIRSPELEHLWIVVREMAAATRELLGEERLAWLRGLPLVQIHDPLAIVHASPESSWVAPSRGVSDQEIHSLYAPLGQPVVTYGHIHQPYVRTMAGLTVANSGSVGLPYDGDRRASYLLIDGTKVEIRRVEYNLAKELKALRNSGIPNAAWIAKTLESGSPQIP